jgi:hypothetical protein
MKTVIKADQTICTCTVSELGKAATGKPTDLTASAPTLRNCRVRACV